MLKIVVDTNVLVSSLLEIGPSKMITDLWIDGRFELITSPKLFNELLTALKKPKLANRVSQADIDNFSSLILADATIVTPAHTINICRDPKDNKVIECAIQAKANIIATGDKDLLILHPFHGIDIIPPAEVIKRIVQ